MRELRLFSPSLRAAREAVSAADSRCAVARAAARAEVSLDAAGGLAGGRDDWADVGPAGMLNLKARRNVYSGGAAPARIRQSEADLAAARARLDRAEADAGYDLLNAYADVLFAQERVPLAGSVASRRETNAALVLLRYEAGRENRGVLEAANAALQEARMESRNASGDARRARQSLALLLGRPRVPEARITDLPELPDLPSEPDLAAVAERTPEFRALLQRAASVHAGNQVLAGSRSPSVDAVGILSPHSESWSSQDRQWFIGLVFAYPLYQGGRESAEDAAARASAAEVRARIDAERNSLVLALGKALGDARRAFDRIESAAASVRAAELRSDIAAAEYAAGLLSFTSWDTVENERVRRREEFLGARREVLLARGRWFRLAGTGPLNWSAGDTNHER